MWELRGATAAAPNARPFVQYLCSWRDNFGRLNKPLERLSMSFSWGGIATAAGSDDGAVVVSVTLKTSPWSAVMSCPLSAGMVLLECTQREDVCVRAVSVDADDARSLVRIPYRRLGVVVDARPRDKDGVPVSAKARGVVMDLSVIVDTLRGGRAVSEAGEVRSN